MRNPWGKGEWIGDWSDNSPLWTPQLRQMYNVQKDKDDGIFYIPFDEYLQQFDRTTFGMEVADRYKHSNFFYRFGNQDVGKPQAFFSFTLKQIRPE